jgi:nitrite reductase/ring-hydroxylating ferredoxin subunit
VIPIRHLTDPMRAALNAIRAGSPFAGLSKTGEMNRRRMAIYKLIDGALVAATPDGTNITVNEPAVAKCERTWGHAVRPLDAHERADVERAHGRVTQWSPPGGYTTCTGSKCPHKATSVTLYSYVTGRRGRVSCAERFVCDAHAEKFRTKYGVAKGAPDAPNVGAERRELMSAVIKSIGEM